MRDATARFVLTILTALLLVLQFPAPTAHFASSHSAQEPTPAPGERYAGDLPGEGVQKAGRAYIPCGPPAHDGNPNGLLRTGDRHRTAVGSTPETLSRSLVTGDTAGRPPTAELVALDGSHRTSRSPTALSPAVLQVFRC